MDMIHKVCSGCDVHKETVVACIRRIGEGGKIEKEVRTFKTVTRELLALSDWLTAAGVRHVAMESTGVYWKPVWNILSGGGFELMLVNPEYLKHFPQRKTDVKDCEWIAELLQYGLLKPSFIPGEQIKELRDLTRQRVKLTQQKAAVANRIQKVLEETNIKLASYISDVLGVSGRRILKALIAGETDCKKLATLADGRLRARREELELALEGRITEHHRFMLAELLEQLEFLERKIEVFEARIEGAVAPFEWAVQRADEIPGIARCVANSIIAEIGTEMKQYPSQRHLSSWGGMCPGNNESAGKRKSGKTPKGNRWLRRALAEAAWAASHTRGTYLSALYRRICRRRGKKRAIVATGHAILTSIYHMLKNNCAYKELGEVHFDKIKGDQMQKYYVKRLAQLGFKVTIETLGSVA
jgi:transposase